MPRRPMAFTTFDAPNVRRSTGTGPSGARSAAVRGAGHWSSPLMLMNGSGASRGRAGPFLLARAFQRRDCPGVSPDQLYRAAGAAALAGGVLRIIAAFPLSAGPTTLEWLYTAIDALLLLGLIGIYLSRAARLGYLGFASFVVAVVALSFIGGPDADPFGFSTYQEGATTLAIAMVGLSLAWVRAGERPWIAPLLWFSSVVIAGILALLPAPLPSYGLSAAGILFGAGFGAAGLVLLRRNSAGGGPSSPAATI